MSEGEEKPAGVSEPEKESEAETKSVEGETKDTTEETKEDTREEIKEEIKDEDKKSEDKQEIEEEEKLAEKEAADKEPKRPLGGEVERKKKALEEAAAQEQGTKRRVPTGGIKIPGFLRPKSRDKNKEGEVGDVEEGRDLLEPVAGVQEENKQPPEQAPSTLASRLRLPASLNSIRIPNVFARFTKDGGRGGAGDEEKGEAEEPVKKPSGARLLNAVKLPVASFLPKLRPTKEAGGGEGVAGGAAGLASVETLDDNSSHRIDENNMENVNLENHEVDAEKAAMEEAESKWASKDWRFYSKRFYEFRYPILGLVVLFVLLVIVISVAVGGAGDAALLDGDPVTTITSCGWIQGVREGGVNVFRGVPYALPPVGVGRWARPRSHSLSDCWNGTRKALVRAPACLHQAPNGTILGAEDCLYLDIITPFVRYDSPLPVVVVMGADSLAGPVPDMWPSLDLARDKEVVFVIPSFRLSVLGFLAAEPISRSTYPHVSGNYGVEDVMAALKWINLNIQHFGGNNASVTVLAHRAAASIISALSTSHIAHKLFTRAWLSSPASVFPNRTMVQSERLSEQYIKSLGCDDLSLDCLRKLDGEEVVKAVPDDWRSADWASLPSSEDQPHSWLIIDGVAIRRHPLEIWTEKNSSVPLVLGSTAQSEWLDDSVTLTDWPEEKVVGRLKSSVLGGEGLVDQVIKKYNSSLAGLQAAIAHIRTVCPLFALRQHVTPSRFYLVTQRRGELADGRLDVDVLLGRWRGVTAHHRQFVSTLRHMFYEFVSEGTLPPPAVLVNTQLTPIKDLPDCDLWAAANFSRFARID